MSEDKKAIVLWTKPLIEIIGEAIYIDDIMVWKSGEFIGRNDL